MWHIEPPSPLHFHSENPDYSQKQKELMWSLHLLVFLFLFLSSTLTQQSYKHSSEVLFLSCVCVCQLMDWLSSGVPPTCSQMFWISAFFFLTQKPLWHSSGLSLHLLTQHNFVQSAFLSYFSVGCLVFIRCSAAGSILIQLSLRCLSPAATQHQDLPL